MVTRNIAFPDELYSRLKEIAKTKGVTIAAIIKIACDEYAKKEGKN
jgi:predicted DNA-binding protein